MKNCKGCKYVEWERTKTGGLHPSGEGHCKFIVKMPILPAAFYWISGPPTPLGGYVSRKKDFKDHCPHYST